jgi:hypothetical protein
MSRTSTIHVSFCAGRASPQDTTTNPDEDITLFRPGKYKRISFLPGLKAAEKVARASIFSSAVPSVVFENPLRIFWSATPGGPISSQPISKFVTSLVLSTAGPILFRTTKVNLSLKIKESPG